MHIKEFDSYYVLRLQKDEEIINAMKKAIQTSKIPGGFFFGLGVGKNLELGYFDLHKKSYTKKQFENEYEFTSFSGNISRFNEEIVIHCHVTITDADFNAYGGHLFEGKVPATLEIIIFPFIQVLKRKKDDATGLNLLDV